MRPVAIPTTLNGPVQLTLVHRVSGSRPAVRAVFVLTDGQAVVPVTAQFKLVMN